MLVVVLCFVFLFLVVEIERIANMDEEPTDDVWGFAGFADMGLVCLFVFLVLFVFVFCVLLCLGFLFFVFALFFRF